MNRFRHIVISITIAAMSLVTTAAQEIPASPVLSVGTAYHRSFIIQHTKKLAEEMTSAHPWIIEYDVNWHLRSHETWQYCYCYPRTGISFRYIDFDMPDLLGYSLAAYPFIEPFIGAGQRLSFSIRFGLGPAYVSEVYNEVTNPDNLFFSAHLSFLATLNAAANVRISNRLSLRLAANYNHISNGGYSEPNLGMNFPSVSLGGNYSFCDNVFEVRLKPGDTESRSKKTRFDISTGISAKPPSATYPDTRYPVISTGLNFSRATGRIFALSVGVEWVNDLSLKKLVRLKSILDENGEYPDHNRIGALAGVEWLFGRFIFSQHAGVYLYAPVPAKNRIYQRYSLLFRIHDHVYTGISIKAHAQDADFLEVRLALSI